MRQFYLYKNELKNKKVLPYKLIGITSELILSKEMFKSNKDIIPFLDEVYSVKFLPYVIKSRTSIVARITRIIAKCDEKDIFKIKNKLYNYLNQWGELHHD